MRRTRPHCALLCARLRASRSRAQACVFNFGNLVKKNSPIRRIKLSAKVSSYTVVQRQLVDVAMHCRTVEEWGD